MARNDGRREVQHYVPKLLLRNFASNPDAKRGSERIYVLDKSKGAIFNPNINKIAAQAGFYAAEHGEFVVNLEPRLGVIESGVAPVLERICQERTLSWLSDRDRSWLAIFCAVQFVRVEQFREHARQLDASLTQLVISLGHDPDAVEGWRRFEDENEVKKFALSFLDTAMHEFSYHFADKQLFLLEAPESAPLYLGDNPVILRNERDFGPRGNIGLAVPGIEIYLPISPRLAIGMWHPSNLPKKESEIAEFDRELKQVLLLRVMRGGVLGRDAEENIKQSRASLESNQQLIEAVRSGGAWRAPAETVAALNKLQVYNASRFVMSAQKNFAPAMRLLSEEPDLRNPPRMGIG